MTPPLLENENLIIVDKPADWLTVPSRQGVDDARPVLGRALEERCGCRIFPVHRLDEGVTGLVLFAKTATAHRAANAWFEKSLVQKEYEALTVSAGEPPLEDFEWTNLLARGKKRAYIDPRIGKKSVTRGNCAGPWGPWLLWRLRPETGRSHQLRFELFHHGFPIVGDALYGSTEPWPRAGIALRMCHLDFRRCPGATSLGLPAELRSSLGIRDLALGPNPVPTEAP